MFDIGGWEFLLVAILGIIIIGPKELPGVIRTVSMFVRRARGLAREFQSGLEEVAREAELDGITDGIKDIGNPAASIRERIQKTIDPDDEMRQAMDYDPDWRDDDLTDYAEEFGDENKMLAPETEREKPPKDTSETSGTDPASDAEAEAAVEPDAGNAEKPAAAETDTNTDDDKKPGGTV